MGKSPDKLAEYNARRDFGQTDEPEGRAGAARAGGLSFVVQKHAASRLHYDFRLEWDGTLLSWAVTKGPSPDPGEKRLAVRTEDHPLDYGDFEGTIPKGQYGGGTVMLWDRGTWEHGGDVAAGLEKGKLKFTLQGERMKGGWALVRMRGGEKRENWLLIKERDDYAQDDADALTKGHDRSVKTGRDMDAIAQGEKGRDVPKDTTDRKGTRPKFRKPQLATLVDAAPEGDDWIHETKFDGYRCLAALGKGGTRLLTRSGKDWTDRFAALEDAFDPLPCDSALIDGEVMAARVSGSAFSSLQKALSNGDPLVFFAFDLLALDGESVMNLPQLERRERLAELMSGVPRDGPLRLSEHVVGHGPEVFEKACEAGGEGIISKRADAPYRGTRTRNWRKVKCTKRQEFVIGGYSPSEKDRPFASLLLGTWDDDVLRYRGRVGTGFDERSFERLEQAFTARKTTPFADVPKAVARDARWLRPELVAEVDFTEFTSDGQIRHGSYLGLRDDKKAKDVTMEKPQDAKVAGIKISSPDREVFPGAGCTKRDIACHYDRVGERMIEAAGHRPLSLLRCPDGIDGDCFFQKHPGKGWPDALEEIEIEEKDGKSDQYLYATRAKALVAAAQMGAIEFHIWGARTDRLERPDRMVFDLDPDEGLDWNDVRGAAFDMRDRLTDLGLASVPMVTGGKGVHVCLHLRRSHGWDVVKGFAKTLAHVIAEAEPDRYTATMSKAKRKRRIFIDWLRNERGQTAIAPYSLRARPGAPVAVPVTWEELKKLDAPNGFTMGDMRERLEDPCPWLEAGDDLQTLTQDTVARLEKWSADSQG
ncbi:DNA ligase D [Roseovarius spongiae]|uniref:DNA ligase (ATP) n=1 Tax=Roseovarius spongiae TaxID=2320272 RepID=A0A3A8AUV6_9RHOB|nr:DNA ligase D [Roseovarius spongiae]RKF12709.1 DNA ligase D [Roseovarius spongiae]